MFKALTELKVNGCTVEFYEITNFETNQKRGELVFRKDGEIKNVLSSTPGNIKELEALKYYYDFWLAA